MPVEPFALFFFVGLLVVGLYVWGRLRQRQREEALRCEASRLDLQYEPTATEDLAGSYRHLQALSGGRSPRCLNLLRGRYQDIEVRYFDFQFVTGGGKHRSVHTWAVAFAFLPRSFSKVTIVPESFGHKVWDAIGGEDIDFESQEFSDRFWVKADDRKFAYDLIHARTMELLLEPGWSHWEINGPVLAVWNPQERWSGPRVEEIAPALGRLTRFVSLIPAHAHDGRPAVTVTVPPARRRWWS